MNIDNFKNVKTLDDIRKMIELSDWKIYQIIDGYQITILSPDNRLHLTINTDRFNSAVNKIVLFDRESERSKTNKQIITSKGLNELYELARFKYLGFDYELTRN